MLAVGFAARRHRRPRDRRLRALDRPAAPAAAAGLHDPRAAPGVAIARKERRTGESSSSRQIELERQRAAAGTSTRRAHVRRRIAGDRLRGQRDQVVAGRPFGVLPDRRGDDRLRLEAARAEQRNRRLKPALRSVGGDHEAVARGEHRAPSSTAPARRCPAASGRTCGSCSSVRRASPGTGSAQNPSATSSRWLSSSRQRWPVVASDASTAIPGCASRSRASSAGRSSWRAAGELPSRSVPSTPRPASAASANAASTAASAPAPSASSLRPASVSSTRRVVRTNRSTPELGLELADRLTQRRGGHVQPIGRAREAQLLRDRHEVPQMAQLGHPLDYDVARRNPYASRSFVAAAPHP